MAQYLQTNSSSERTNQIMEIALRFFIHAMENLSYWPKVLPRIQSLLNNIFFSTTRKTPNEITYSFLPKKSLDLILAMAMPNTYVAHIDAANAILFALLNQKEYYNKKYQLFFIKVGDWAMLRIYKSYSILPLAEVTKRLTQ